MRAKAIACLRHYVATACKDKAQGAATVFIGSLLRVDRNTVRRWVVGTNKPIGNIFLKLIHLLAAIGYEVEELQKLPQPLYDVGLAVVLEVISLDDLVAQSKLTRYSVLLGLQGKRAFSERILAVFERMNQSVVARVSDRLKAYCVRATEKGQVALEPSTFQNGKTDDAKVILERLAAMITAMRPYAELVASERFSPEDRRRLRDIVGEGAIFNLSTALNCLCGETARSLSRSRSS